MLTSAGAVPPDEPVSRASVPARRGGVSEGPYASLNCSLSGQDDPGRVRENRRRAADTLGLPAPALGLGLAIVVAIVGATVPSQGVPPFIYFQF